MAHRYAPAYMQLVWAVKFRQSLIPECHREEVERIITGWFRRYGHQVVAIFCRPDHLHVLFKYHPAQSVSELVKVVKAESTRFIKERGICPHMRWQRGYALLTYSYEAVPTVAAYIRNQAAHHSGGPPFVEEAADLLTAEGETWDERFFFEELVDWETLNVDEDA